jgi:hypothetical protein
VKIGDDVQHLPGVAEALGRGGSACELCRSTRDLEASHRHARAHGGLWTPPNILCLCHDCHQWCHHNPTAAYAGGWHLRDAPDLDLTTVRVWLQGRSGYLIGWALLDDDGLWQWLDDDRPPELPPAARLVTA